MAEDVTPSSPVTVDPESGEALPIKTGEAVEAPQEVVEAPPEAKPETKPQPDWRVNSFQKRVDKLTARNKELEAELARARSASPSPAPDLEALVESRASEKAKVLAAQERFYGDVNAALAAGKETFGEVFDKSVSSLRALNDPSDSDTNSRYLTMVQGMLDTGDAAKLIHLLGSDPSEAARIMEMSPTKQGIELARLAAREAPAAPSGAPKPIVPLSGAGNRSHVAIAAEDPDRADSLGRDAWFARRQAHVDEVNKNSKRRVL